MTARTKTDLRYLAIFLGAAVAGGILFALVDNVQRAHAAADVADVASDHAPTPPPCLSDGVPLVNPVPTMLKPGWPTRAIVLCRDLGKRTGGSGAVLVLGALVDRARDRKPGLKKGRIGRFTLGLWAALLWAGGSLATGATWGTALGGVILAILTGAVWAAVPPPKSAEPRVPT